MNSDPKPARITRSAALRVIHSHGLSTCISSDHDLAITLDILALDHLNRAAIIVDDDEPNEDAILQPLTPHV